MVKQVVYTPSSKSTNDYFGSTTQDYLKPTFTYLEYLYSKGNRLIISHRGNATDNHDYTIPSGYTFFLCSVTISAVRDSVVHVGNTADIQIVINPGVSNEIVLSAELAFTSTNHTSNLSLNPSFPIKVISNELLRIQSFTADTDTQFAANITGFLVENKYLIP